MLMPIFGKDFFDDFFDAPRMPAPRADLMKTDLREDAEGYVLDIDMPGVKKEDMQAELKDGYLTVSAKTGYENNQQDKQGRYLRRERFSGSFSRNFYVGEDVTQEDIKARFENGVLTIRVPKKQPVPQVEEKKYIAIEG